MSTLSFPVIGPRRRRLRLPWGGIWLTVVAFLALLPWSVANDLNPATVPSALVLGTVWFWTLAWRPLQQRLPHLRLYWFGPAVLQAVLIATTGFFSLLFLLMRDHALQRTVSPDGRIHAVLLAAPGGAEHYLAQEERAGLMVRRVSRVNYALGKPVPQRFELRWRTDTKRLELWGDGRLLDARPYTEGRLVLSRELAEAQGLSGESGSGSAPEGGAPAGRSDGAQ